MTIIQVTQQLASVHFASISLALMGSHWVMRNPYRPIKANSSTGYWLRVIHPDWKWMGITAYGLAVFCMVEMLGKSNHLSIAIFGVDHGIVPGPAELGYTNFRWAIPILAAIPALLVSLVFKKAYLGTPPAQPKTFTNFLFLISAIAVAVLNIGLYRATDQRSPEAFNEQFELTTSPPQRHVTDLS